MSTNAFAAKRALIARLQELAAPGGTIHAQVAYAWPGATLEQIVVYGGFVTFEQTGDKDATDGHRRLVHEDAQIGLHIEATVSPPPPNGAEGTDELVEAIGDELGALFQREPNLCGGNSEARIVGGNASYQPTDTAMKSTLSYRINVESYLGI